MKQVACLLGSISSTVIASLACLQGAYAQIVPDNTLPTPSQVAPGCTICRIDGGTIRGNNLFHSFKDFSILTDGEAWFNNTLEIHNILTRVTGTSISNIDGLIKTNGAANLFFLNPNGIVFGPHAHLQIGGSFFASTASSFKFPDGSEFSAIAPQAPPLLTIDVPLGLQTGPIQPGATLSNRGNLTVGHNLTLKADQLDLQGQLQAGDTLVLQANNTVKIRDDTITPFIAQAGKQLLVRGNQGVDIFALNHPDSRLVSGGDMVLQAPNSVIGDAHYYSGGNFRIEQLDGNLGTLFSSNDPVIRSLGDVSFNAYQGASLHILAAGKIEIPGFIYILGTDTVNGLVDTVPLSDGSSVSINGQAEPTLDIRAGVSPQVVAAAGVIGTGLFLPTPISTSTPSSADIRLGLVTVFDTSGAPVPGKILVTNQYQPNLSLPGDIQLSTIFNSNSVGGGLIAVDSRRNLSVTGIVSASPSAVGTTGTFIGNGGDITFLAKGNLTVEANPAVFPTAVISSIGSVGGTLTIKSGETVTLRDALISNGNVGMFPNLKGGSLNINARSLSMNNTLAATSTSGNVNAGDINLDVADTISISGVARIFNPDGTIQFEPSGLQSTVQNGAIANSGAINIATGSLVINGGQLQTLIRGTTGLPNDPNALPAGQGQAGDVHIRARGSVLLDSTNAVFQSSIQSGLGLGARGNGGNIEIAAESLSLKNEASLLSSTSGQGNAGEVKLNIQKAMTIAETSGIQSNVEWGGVGNGGAIDIQAGNLTLTNGGQIQTIVRRPLLGTNGVIVIPAGRGNAGNVQIKVQNDLVLDGTSVSLVNGANAIFPSIITSAVDTGATGQAGNITLSAGTLSLTDGGRILSSTFGQGNAGDITANIRNDTTINQVENGFSSGIFSTVESGSQGEGGDIAIRAGDLTLTNGGQIQTLVRDALFTPNGGIAVLGGQGDAGNIQINVDGAVRLDGTAPVLPQANGTLQIAPTQLTSSLGFGAAGRAGNIAVQASSFSLTNGAQVLSSTAGLGNAGNTTINTQQAITIDGFASVSAPDGTPRISLSGIYSTVELGGIGDGGNIVLDADSLAVTNAAQVQTINRLGQGNAGNIAINVQGQVLLNNTGFIASGIGLGAAGNGGNINVLAGSLALNNFSEINSSTFGQGNAGNISAQITDHISLNNSSQIIATVEPGGQGRAGDIDIQSKTLTASNGSQIASALFRQGFLPGGQGEGGNVRVTASDAITLAGTGPFGFSSGILALSERGASGPAGNITVNTGDLKITDGAVILASTFNRGDGGNISVNTNTVEAINGGQIVTNTRSSGRAGNITLTVRDSVLLAGSDPNWSDRQNRINQYLQLSGNADQFNDVVANVGKASGLFANTEPASTGNGGSITITAPRTTIQDGAVTLVNSQGSGRGGNITIQGNRLTLDHHATLSAETASSQGGNITLRLQDLLLLRHNSLISATAGTAQAGGNGGNISIKSPFILGVLAENSDITANAFTGKGGNINITANGIFGLRFQPRLTPNSDITASSQFGLSGTVTLNLLSLDPSQGLVELPVGVVDPSQQIQNNCSKEPKARSSFKATGRGGIPSSPSDSLQDASVLVNWIKPVNLDDRQAQQESENRVQQNQTTMPPAVTPSSHQSPPSSFIVEAQGWIVDPNGSIYLVTQIPNSLPHSSWQVPIHCDETP